MSPLAARYDILMDADIGSRVNRKGQNVATGKLLRFAYSPAIGESEERRRRLEDLLAGRRPEPVGRRPQPELPKPPTDSDVNPPARDLPRIGHNKVGD